MIVRIPASQPPKDNPHNAARGLVWGLIICVPFWTLVLWWIL